MFITSYLLQGMGGGGGQKSWPTEQRISCIFISLTFGANVEGVILYEMSFPLRPSYEGLDQLS